MSTTEQLLDNAQQLIASRGVNAFSYKDLAHAVGIKTASIHYHFPTKADLIAALMGRYLNQLETELERIDARRTTHANRLKALTKLYRDTERRSAICICGSLAADRESISDESHRLIEDYLERTQRWVADAIRAGTAAGEFSPQSPAKDLAAALVAGLQGGLVVARGQGRTGVIDAIQRTLFASLRAG